MRTYTILSLSIFLMLGCKTANTPTFDFGNYSYSTTGVRNDLDGKILVKTTATGQNYEDVKQNAIKKALNDIMLTGIDKGCSNCIKQALFVNRQKNPRTTKFLEAFFSNREEFEKYALITREFATWEQKRDLKFTQNQPLGFEVLISFEDLKNLIKKSISYEN